MVFLKASFVAAEVEYITVCCARVHLEEPALNIHALSYELELGLVGTRLTRE